MKTLLGVGVLAAMSTCLAVDATAATADSQEIVVEHALQIPGETLPPGKYKLSLEDRLRGRAIVRIDSGGDGQHTFLLSVPSLKITASEGPGLIFFANQNSQQILRGWLCPSCAKPLEFVYGKEEAVKITGETGQSVLAADPAYDKLPANLSPDDMKVVTLWLLSPERVSNDHGVGLKAAKYVAPGGMPAVPTRNQLPQTASDAYSFLAAGLALLAGFGMLRIHHHRRERCDF